MFVFKIVLSMCFVTSLFSASQKLTKTIGIFTFRFDRMAKWDPDSIHEGIGGSEESVIYMSQQLAKLGYQVTVYGNPPEKSKHSDQRANPRYIDIDRDDRCKYDIAICWRIPTDAMKIKKRASKVYFWPHDTCDRVYDDEVIQAFDEVFWLSQFQRLSWGSKNLGFFKYKNIYGNGVNPEQFHHDKTKRNPHSCIYASNYGRGLEVLLDIWPIVKKHFPSATLDVYYGWNSWGILKPDKEEKLKKQFAGLAELDVTDHGRVGHHELHRAFARASIWTYPCIADETFCITGSKAQLSEAFPVVINHSALKETVKSGFRCPCRKQYCATLMKAMIQAEKMSKEQRKALAKPVLENWTWEKIAESWSKVFESDS